MSCFSQLNKDLEYIRSNDPAAKSKWEILFCYFGLHAVYLHKLANWFYRNDFFFIARLVSNVSRFFTGVEIHPGAKIANKVFIDHGIGVVIGETTEIEEEVIIYQGVTLGGTSTKQEKRHPTIKRGAVIGSHAQILGNITVGEEARVGASSVVINDVPMQTTVVGIPARIVSKAPSEKLAHDEIPDIILAYLKKLENEIALLKEQLNKTRI
ncbi:MAG: serine O-acetyltransferase [Candidatus Caenarcaniphilales bacterium]|nr:serine O-acetyltransferase [Candidatus Caenarcaniphilales bacterium]